MLSNLSIPTGRGSLHRLVKCAHAISESQEHGGTDSYFENAVQCPQRV
jgi:hypothetical protein